MSVINQLLAQQPLFTATLLRSLIAQFPVTVLDQLDGVLDDTLRLLASGDDVAVCDRLRALVTQLGINLDEYRD
jgi:hypothetical protein